MAVTFSGRVGEVLRSVDGQDAPTQLTNQNAVLMQQSHGRYYNSTLRGRMFSQAVTPLGLAIPIYTATAIAGAVPIWNPPDSGVNVVPVFVDLGYGSGTADFGAIGLMARKLRAIATGELMTAMANTTPMNGLFGAGQSSKTLSSNAGTCTVTAGAAGDWIRTIASINLEAATGTAHGTLVVHYDFDGSLIVPPGNLIYLAATKASVAIYASTVVWEEQPI